MALTLGTTLLYTTTTCKLQGRNRYDYITVAVVAKSKGEQIPPLLPAERKSDSLDLAA